MKVRFEAEKLREILVNFYNLTNMRFAIFDEDFNRILAYPEESSPFCAMLKSQPETRRMCRSNDKAACEYCKKTNKLHIYECHAGLIEVVAPIKMNGINLGYIMFGQICKKDADRASIKDYVKPFFEDEEKISMLVKKIVSKTDKQISAVAQIMEICTSYLCLYDIIKIDNDNLIFHLSNYIDSKISSNELTVEELCSVFDLSRSKLYEMSHKYYGMSIAKYIKKKRIEKAKALLKSKKFSIAEVAEKSGLYDANYFSKVFKAEEGISPKEYKKRIVV